MKRFQEWMDCQLYTSHLRNLTKIKERALAIRSQSKSRKAIRNIASLSNHEKIRDLNQSLSAHTHSNSRSEPKQNKTDKISQENINLAYRLIQVAPVISRDKQIESYNKYRTIFRRKSGRKKLGADRDRKLQNFLQINQRNYVKGIHKNLVKVLLYSIPKVPEGNFNSFWLELGAGREKVSTQHIKSEELLLKEIAIPIKNTLGDKKIHLTLHCSRNLEYINLGTYEISSAFKKIAVSKQFTALQNSRQSIQAKICCESLGTHIDKKSIR